MKFLVDNQLPLDLCRWLASKGQEFSHVLDLGLEHATDREIWASAGEQGAVLVSKDEDFFHLAGLPGSTGRLLWVRLGNCRTPTLIAAFEQLWPDIQSRLEAGERVVEVR